MCVLLSHLMSPIEIYIRYLSVQFQMCVICAIRYVHAQALKSQDSYKIALDNNTPYHVKLLLHT